MQTLLFTKQVKTYIVKCFQDENGQQFFNCNCIHFKTSCLKRGVPCKHTLSVLFTQGDCLKWEKLRSKYAKSKGLKSEVEAEMILGIALRQNEQTTTQWFLENR
jgi:uncharacterized Zn finger protein